MYMNMGVESRKLLGLEPVSFGDEDGQTDYDGLEMLIIKLMKTGV